MKSKAINTSTIRVRPPGSLGKSIAEVRQQEAKDANERLEKLEEEQRSLEEEMREKAAAVEINRNRIDDARSIARLNEARAKECEEFPERGKPSSCICNDKKANRDPITTYPIHYAPLHSQAKLKGVQLRTFSGDDKIDFEAWNAAFTSVVDETNMPIKEKMLRLQNCLEGKALETVKDLGYTEYAYEKAKEKLQRKYGGKRKQTLTHLATHRA